MDPQKITYTLNWSDNFETWNIPNIIKMLETARSKAIELTDNLVEKQLETTTFAEANEVLSKIRSMK
jgi:hypothetical protein